MAGSDLVVVSVIDIVASLASLAVSVGASMAASMVASMTVSLVASVVVSVDMVVGTARRRSVLSVSVGERAVVISVPVSVDS